MKYLVCNFKNKLTKKEIIKYSSTLGDISSKIELVLVPSLPYLSYFQDKEYKLGSQDISSFMDLTVTGEVTGEQLKSMGVSYVIVGHSERREYKKEINIDFINKISSAVESGIKVIYCIGEPLKVKEDGDTFMYLEQQISEVLNNVSLKDLIIAYEPVYAIGSGIVPDIDELKEIIEFIKDIIMEKYEVKLPVLYGGSVNSKNIKDFMTIDELDGFLVGGASLDVDEVREMVINVEEW